MLRISQTTEATDLPLYCTSCKREFIVQIHRGQVSYEPEP